MPRSSRFSYQKLKKDPTLYEEEEKVLTQFQAPARNISSGRRIRLKRRWRFRVPRLRRFFKRVAKGNLVWGISWAKIVRRLKESQAHFGDIFAGNYLFLQVTPEALKNTRSKPQPLNLAYLPSARA